MDFNPRSNTFIELFLLQRHAGKIIQEASKIIGELAVAGVHMESLENTTFRAIYAHCMVTFYATHLRK